MSLVNEHTAHEPCVSLVEARSHADTGPDAILLTLGKICVEKDQLEKEVKYLRETINAERLLHAKAKELRRVEQQRIKASANSQIEQLKAEKTTLDADLRKAIEIIQELGRENKALEERFS